MLRASILLGLLSLALAADLPIVFTSTPPAAIVGKTYNLTWSGGDGVSQITIELRRGDPADLMWVAYLTTDASNGFFLWTVSEFANASDYALQIFEMANITNVNYSAPFSLSGGTSAPTATTMNRAVGTGEEVSSMDTGTALPRNTTLFAATFTSLAICSGLNGICATAAPTSTSTVIMGTTDVRTSSDSGMATVTATATGEAFRLSSFLKHALVPVALLMLGML